MKVVSDCRILGHNKFDVVKVIFGCGVVANNFDPNLSDSPA
jgi:hypothetical protein